ncbi:hypothetical protein G3M48_004908 [Beauveria asiatica]|uniref:Aminoglycoside phosphotransferase domain-containing protein n=1 Tax=Beauveria asiatica TaxID=1069075 RepID=A0AAW0S5U1_9HYPO
MTTRQLLSGPITLSDATARSTNVLHALRYPLLKQAFYERVESHRALLAEVIAHHLGTRPTAVEISTQEWWRHGSFNLCVPVHVHIDPVALLKVPEFVMIRFPLPYRVGETTRPGNSDEKLNCEAATYAWLRENCPSVPIPRLYGFGLSTNQRYTDCDLLPWWSRFLQCARRALMSALGLQQPSRYVSHTSTRFAALDIGYLIIETVTSGEMLSESWEENRDNPKLLENLQRGLARIMLSLASVNLPRIGSFRLDHNGYLRLDNRPLSVQTTVHENEGLPLDMPRQTTLSTSKDLILSQLSAFDDRLLNQPNAVVSREDAWYQMASLATAKLTLPQLLRQEFIKGPFTLTLTDLHRSNVFVDGDWNVTCIIDLEFACSWPIDFLQTPYWLDADFIDQILPDQFASRHDQFIKYMKDEEQLKNYRGDEEPLSSILHQSWEKGTFWVPLALRDAVAYTTIFYQQILPNYFNFPTEELNDGAYTRFCCRFWSPNVPSLIDRKLRDRDDYLNRLKQTFADPA